MLTESLRSLNKTTESEKGLPPKDLQINWNQNKLVDSQSHKSVETQKVLMQYSVLYRNLLYC